MNNQFQQYVFDVSKAIAKPVAGNNNLTVDFESAWYYGLNVTARPDAEFFPGGPGTGVRTSDNVSHFLPRCDVHSDFVSSMNTLACVSGSERSRPILDGIG